MFEEAPKGHMESHSTSQKQLQSKTTTIELLNYDVHEEVTLSKEDLSPSSQKLGIDSGSKVQPQESLSHLQIYNQIHHASEVSLLGQEFTTAHSSDQSLRVSKSDSEFCDSRDHFHSNDGQVFIHPGFVSRTAILQAQKTAETDDKSCSQRSTLIQKDSLARATDEELTSSIFAEACNGTTPTESQEELQGRFSLQGKIADDELTPMNRKHNSRLDSQNEFSSVLSHSKRPEMLWLRKTLIQTPDLNGDAMVDSTLESPSEIFKSTSTRDELSSITLGFFESILSPRTANTSNSNLGTNLQRKKSRILKTQHVKYLMNFESTDRINEECLERDTSETTPKPSAPVSITRDTILSDSACVEPLFNVFSSEIFTQTSPSDATEPRSFNTDSIVVPDESATSKFLSFKIPQEENKLPKTFEETRKLMEKPPKSSKISMGELNEGIISIPMRTLPVEDESTISVDSVGKIETPKDLSRDTKMESQASFLSDVAKLNLFNPQHIYLNQIESHNFPQFLNSGLSHVSSKSRSGMK